MLDLPRKRISHKCYSFIHLCIPIVVFNYRNICFFHSVDSRVWCVCFFLRFYFFFSSVQSVFFFSCVPIVLLLYVGAGANASQTSNVIFMRMLNNNNIRSWQRSKNAHFFLLLVRRLLLPPFGVQSTTGIFSFHVLNCRMSRAFYLVVFQCQSIAIVFCVHIFVIIFDVILWQRLSGAHTYDIMTCFHKADMSAIDTLLNNIMWYEIWRASRLRVLNVQ